MRRTSPRILSFSSRVSLGLLISSSFLSWRAFIAAKSRLRCEVRGRHRWVSFPGERHGYRSRLDLSSILDPAEIMGGGDHRGVADQEAGIIGCTFRFIIGVIALKVEGGKWQTMASQLDRGRV